MKILWLTNIPSPYRMKFFNELGKQCELTVLFERKSSSERDESWDTFSAKTFKAIIMPGIKMNVAEAFCPSVIKYINKKYDHIVVTNFSDPTGMLAILSMRIRKISYEVESDGAFPKDNRSLKAKIKKFIFIGAKKCFSTAKLNDEYYLLNGATRDKIVRYPFTSVMEEEVLLEPVSFEIKNNIRKKIHIKERYMILAVGQFIYRKGFDILIKSASYLGRDYGIYIVGGYPPKEYIQLITNLKLENVHFIKFQLPEVLREYYDAADVFVHPTREDIWGLVINESMARGLPVVTTDCCIAGMEMISNGINGIVVPAEDEKLLADAICQCIEKQDMKKEAIGTALKYTIERMVYEHIKIWNSEAR